MDEVYTSAVHCPACHSTNLRVYKTMPADEGGAVARYAQCLACAHRFRLITEPKFHSVENKPDTER